MSIWSFKIKRDPDGRLINHKAHLCAHGVMQQWGVNYWETYPPVVNWVSVRVMLTLGILHKIHTKLVDFFWLILRLMLIQKSTWISHCVFEFVIPP